MRLMLLTPLLLVLGIWGCGTTPVTAQNEQQETASASHETEQIDSTEVNEEESNPEDDCD